MSKVTGLSKEGKEDIALALILLKDFKTNGKFDVEATKAIIELAQYLGVYEEYNELISKIPPMTIRER
ncbi:MAG: hypothetical protein ACRC62_32250 [Microcoleus sp.]